MDLREKVAETLTNGFTGMGIPTWFIGRVAREVAPAILALWEEERRELTEFMRIIQVGLQPGGSPPPTSSLLARWIVRSVQDEREAAEARCVSLEADCDEWRKQAGVQLTAATVMAKRCAELEAHEKQTHETLGAILGTDTSLEDAARRMQARCAKLAEALASVQWSSVGVCPVCLHHRIEGHSLSCKISDALIAAVKEEPR